MLDSTITPTSRLRSSSISSTVSSTSTSTTTSSLSSLHDTLHDHPPALYPFPGPLFRHRRRSGRPPAPEPEPESTAKADPVNGISVDLPLAELGLKATGLVSGEILELVTQLEAANTMVE